MRQDGARKTLTPMAILTKTQILTSDDLPTETVAVPEWGGDVLVRTMPGIERDDFEAELVKRPKNADGTLRDMTGLKALLLSRTIVCEDGTLMFDVEDIDALNAKSSAALNRVADVAQRLNGLTQSDVTELAGNSEGDQSD